MGRYKRSGKVIFWGLSLFSVILLVLPLGPFVKISRAFLAYLFLPPIGASHSIASYIGEIPKKTLSLFETEEENRRLRKLAQENKVLRTQLQSVLKENDRLGEVVSLGRALRWKGIWSRVMARDPLRWQGIIFVNKGSSDGVGVSNAVLAASGGDLALVGRVIEVSKNSAKVLFLNDVMSSVRCYLEDSFWEGLVEGQNREILKLNYIPISANVLRGERILTSPSSSVFPPNILIGKVSGVFPKKDYMTYLSLEVKPSVKISALKEVFLVLERL